MAKGGGGKKPNSKANGKADAGRQGPTARVSEELFRKYSEQEIREEAGRIADAIGQREALQVQMKETGELFRLRRESLDGQIGAAAQAIRGGGVLVPVECEVRFHVPRVGMKQVWRLDTNELVRETEMSVEECQEKLFASQELAELQRMAGLEVVPDAAGARVAVGPAAEEKGNPAEQEAAPAGETPAEQALAEAAASAKGGAWKLSAEEEQLYERALKVLLEANAVSSTLLQRNLKMSYGRAAQLIEWMEERGAVSKLEAGKRQVILRKPSQEAGETGDQSPRSAE